MLLEYIDYLNIKINKVDLVIRFNLIMNLVSQIE